MENDPESTDAPVTDTLSSGDLERLTRFFRILLEWDERRVPESSKGVAADSVVHVASLTPTPAPVVDDQRHDESSGQTQDAAHPFADDPFLNH